MAKQYEGHFVSPLLTNVSLGYRNANYIAEKVYPLVKVKKDSSQIATYSMDNLRVVNTLRAIGSATKEVTHSVTIGDHYFLEDHALKEAVTIEDMENADDPIRPEIDAVENVTDKIWVAKEKALADSITNTSVLTNNTTLTGTDRWSDFVNSDPFDDIKVAKESVRTTSGKIANSLIIARDVFETLLLHPDLIARFPGAVKITQKMVEDSMISLFGLKNIWIGDAQYNSAAEGQTDVLADIWTKDVVVAHVDPRPGLKSRTLGLTYHKEKPRFVDKIGFNQSFETWDRKIHSFVRVNDKFDQKLIDANCGYLIVTAIA